MTQDRKAITAELPRSIFGGRRTGRANSFATSRLRTVDRRVSGADSWQNFYVMVGGAAAALTGLILVAVSLHVRAILGHPLYRDRSFTSLQGW